MKILSSFGIVEIKRGDGTYISRSVSDRLFDHIVFQMILSDADKKKLMEFRELIEVGIIKIVIVNAQDEDITSIKEEFSRLAERVDVNDSDPSVLMELDVRFHRAIGLATKNELIRKVYDFILDFFAPSIRQTHKKPPRGRNALDCHLKILAGIEARDRERAEAAVKESITQWAILSS